MLFYMMNFECFLKKFGLIREKTFFPFDPKNPNCILNFKEQVAIFLKNRTPQSI